MKVSKDKQDDSLRNRITSVLSSMQTDMAKVENIVAEFEKKIEAIMNKIDDLERRVSYLESLLGVSRESDEEGA
ncbi:MAG: hypothetical protein DRO12_03330 [Thermoprotei archaeon]|nr:MAG: hypothetical protein DRO12_03330 [Thermoprotei archaeon]